MFHCLRDSLKSLICFSSFSISFCLRLCSCTGLKAAPPPAVFLGDTTRIDCIDLATSPKCRCFDMWRWVNMSLVKIYALNLRLWKTSKNIHLIYTGMKMDESFSSNNTSSPWTTLHLTEFDMPGRCFPALFGTTLNTIKATSHEIPNRPRYMES